MNKVGLALKSTGATAEIAAKAMKSAGYSITEIGQMLQTVYQLANDQIAAALKHQGFSIGEITEALGSIVKGGHVDIATNTLPHVDTNKHIDTPSGPHADTKVPHVDQSKFGVHVDQGGSHADATTPHVDTKQHVDTPSSHIDIKS